VHVKMWISNVPSSVLCVSIALPIVHQLPSGDPFAKALLLGIAFSNNIGGMTTPIASPQNVIAFGWCEQARKNSALTSRTHFFLLDDFHQHVERSVHFFFVCGTSLNLPSRCKTVAMSVKVAVIFEVFA
jgi:hypothetical protein